MVPSPCACVRASVSVELTVSYKLFVEQGVKFRHSMWAHIHPLVLATSVVYIHTHTQREEYRWCSVFPLLWYNRPI